MLILRTAAALRSWRAELFISGKRIGMVPTMGYLHEGHLSLVKEARNRSDAVLMSIFVNPLQFGPAEDFSRYPRDEARDLSMAEAAGVDAVFIPSVEEMYPFKPMTTVSVAGFTEGLCGSTRPGHFDGVAFVVLKLFLLAQPDLACFGMKDAQQVAVIRKMAEDLSVPVEIIACPIIREVDGLAMSSRNVYLNEDERRQSPVIRQALRYAEALAADSGNMITLDRMIEQVRAILLTAPLAQIVYLELRTFDRWEVPDLSLRLADAVQQPLLLAAAVRFGNTRLIDNTILHALEGRD